MPAKPNKRRRALNRQKRSREILTAVPESHHTGARRPLAGFEDRYEITAEGHLWSKRAGKFIKHQVAADGERTYLRFSVGGRPHTLLIWQAVADSWLTHAQRVEMVARVPLEQRRSYMTLKCERSLLTALAREYGVATRVVIGVLLDSASTH